MQQKTDRQTDQISEEKKIVKGASQKTLIVEGRVSSEDEKHVCSNWTCLQREHIFKIFNCPTREWVSEPMNGASVAKQSAAEQVSGVSGANEPMNVASDRVAC